MRPALPFISPRLSDVDAGGDYSQEIGIAGYLSPAEIRGSDVANSDFLFSGGSRELELAGAIN